MTIFIILPSAIRTLDGRIFQKQINLHCSNLNNKTFVGMLEYHTQNSVKYLCALKFCINRKKKNKIFEIYRQSNLPVVRRRAPAIVVRGANLRILPLDRRWLFNRVPSELLRPSDNCCSENTDVDIVDAVESPRRLNVPLDEVVVADESLRENIEWRDWPSEDSLSLDSVADEFDWVASWSFDC